MTTYEVPASVITNAASSVTPDKSTESADTNACSSSKIRVSSIVSVFDSDEFKKSGRLPEPQTSPVSEVTPLAKITQGFYCKSAPPYDCQLYCLIQAVLPTNVGTQVYTSPKY